MIASISWPRSCSSSRLIASTRPSLDTRLFGAIRSRASSSGTRASAGSPARARRGHARGRGAGRRPRRCGSPAPWRGCRLAARRAPAANSCESAATRASSAGSKGARSRARPRGSRRRRTRRGSRGRSATRGPSCARMLSVVGSNSSLLRRRPRAPGARAMRRSRRAGARCSAGPATRARGSRGGRCACGTSTSPRGVLNPSAARASGSCRSGPSGSASDELDDARVLVRGEPLLAVGDDRPRRVALWPGFSAITAFTSSPWLSCGMPITAASAIAGCA